MQKRLMHEPKQQQQEFTKYLVRRNMNINFNRTTICDLMLCDVRVLHVLNSLTNLKFLKLENRN